jgi:hypothetical protein
VGKQSPEAWVSKPRIKSILLAFSIPKIPKHVERSLAIKKLKLLPFLKKSLIECLNPLARKGRFYILTLKARKLLQLPNTRKGLNKDWKLIGKIMASPKQKLAVLLTIDSHERTSEEIRLRAITRNPCLSRISTKAVLRDLIAEKLIITELIERRRFYWITEQGMKIRNDLIALGQPPPPA